MMCAETDDACAASHLITCFSPSGFVRNTTILNRYEVDKTDFHPENTKNTSSYGSFWSSGYNVTVTQQHRLLNPRKLQEKDYTTHAA